LQDPERRCPERQVLSPRLHLYAKFHSRFLPDDRDVLVHLPPGYDETPERHYPVLYMQDGQRLFNCSRLNQNDESARTWRAGEEADAAILAGDSEPILIVGVAAAGERRIAEYTPTVDWKLGGGEADKYGRLLVEELLPLIAAQYRVKSGAANNGLGGSSLGGLAALYLGLKYPTVFGKLAVLSPSVWWNHRAILALVGEACLKLDSRPRIWLDVGDGEGERAVADAALLEARLRANGWRPGSDLTFQRVPGGTHDEGSWAKRVQPMLRFLFPRG
jgi:predicted alpha/beta superfamily hydrolase